MPRLIRVLLAEDDENSAKLVIHSLDRYNFAITHVPDGMAALSKVRTETFDLIISDIMMPYLDGLSFIEKAEDCIRNTPVILLTAVGDRRNVLRAAQRHVSHYLLKPVELNALVEKVIHSLRLDPSEIIEKKSHPLKCEFRKPKDEILALEIDGCPGKHSAEAIFLQLHTKIQEDPQILQLDLIVQPFFFLEAGCFRILDDLILKTIKNTNLRTANIRIFAREIQDAKLDPDKFPNLSQCRVESQSETV